MRSNIEVKPKHQQKSSRLSWETTRYSRKYVAFNTFRERFLKLKASRIEYKTYIFRENKWNFAFTTQFPSRCDQTSRLNQNIGKNPQDCNESRQGVPVNMSLSNSFRERFLKSKSFEFRVQDLQFQRKQIKFRLHCTIFI